MIKVDEVHIITQFNHGVLWAMAKILKYLASLILESNIRES